MARRPYTGFVPPCGIFCGTCPVYLRAKEPCPGAEVRCRERRCKGIHVCSEGRSHRFCYECPTFPCSRFRRFATTWLQYGQDLLANQAELERLGEEAWLAERNAEDEDDVTT
ncbi:MAG: DUF3795 domain-containing protein [Anaerolineales bacterium]